MYIPPELPSSICFRIFLPVAVKERKFSLSVSISNCRSWNKKKTKKSGHKATNVSLDDLKNFIDAHTSSTTSQCRKGFMSYQFNISYARRLELCMPRSEDQWALPQFKLRIVDELKFLWEVWYKMPCDDCLRYVFIEDWKILIWLWNITRESSNFKHSDPVDFFNRASVLQLHWHAFPYHKTHLPVCRDSKWFPFFRM